MEGLEVLDREETCAGYEIVLGLELNVSFEDEIWLVCVGVAVWT